MKTARGAIVAPLLMCAPLLAQAPDAPAPRLILSTDGAVLLEEGKPARSFASLAELAAALPGFRGQAEVATSREPPAPPAPASPEAKEKAVSIAAGEVPAVELVKLLADLLGAPVVSEGADQALRERIVFVPKRIDAGDELLVKRLLEASRFRVLETRLGDGQRVVSIEDAQAGFEPAEPRARPVVTVGAGPRPGATTPARTARPPPQEVQGYAGVILEELPEMLRAQLPLELGEGVLVAAVDEALAARSRSLRQLQRFDIVTRVGTTALSRPADLVAALNRIEAGALFELRVLRRGTVKILRGTK